MNGLYVAISASEVADFAGRAAVALVLGAAIGVERQWHRLMAGHRTNALVALGAALVELSAQPLGSQAGIDPTRMAAFMVSGIGSLGAGVILRDGVNVRGINTATTIWCSASVGVLAGAGYIIEAAIGAVLVLIAHVALGPEGRRCDRLPASEESEIEVVDVFHAVGQSANEAHIRALVVQAISQDEFVLRTVREDLDRGTDLVEVEAELVRFGRDDVTPEAAVRRLSLERSFSSVSWSVLEEPGVALAAQV